MFFSHLPALALVLASWAQPNAPLAYDMVDLVRTFDDARAQLTARWRYVPDSICAPPDRRGPSNKTRLASDVWNIIHRSTSVRAQLPEVAAGVPVFASFTVVISHVYKFIYIRQPKASSTSVIDTLLQMYCRDRSNCTELVRGGLTKLSLQLDDTYDSIWREYFVFTVVRHPVTRMLSTYVKFSSHLRLRKSRRSQQPGEYCNIPFLEFSRNVLRLRSVCDTDRCCAFFAKNRNVFMDDFVNTHISQQVHAILTPNGESIVDFIGAVETIDEDWVAITREIAHRSCIETPFHPVLHSNPAALYKQDLVRMGLSVVPSSGNVATAPRCIPFDIAALGLLNDTTAFNIASQFAMDMVLLEYV